MVHPSRNVLLIEQSQDASILIKEKLFRGQTEKYHLRWESNSQAALDAACSGGHDIILIGPLPERDGLTAWIKPIRRAGIRTPILLFVDETTDINAVEEADFDGVDIIDLASFSAAFLEKAIQFSIQHELLEKRTRDLDGLLEYIPEGITIADAPDVKIRTMSKYGLELGGYQREQTLDLPVTERPERWTSYYPDGITKVPPEKFPIYRAIKTGEVIHDEELIMRRPGQEDLFILVNAGPIRNKAGEIIAGVTAWRDITERKQAEAFSTAINQIHEILHSSFEIDELLQRAMIAGAQVLGCDTAGLTLRTGTDWTVRYVYEMPGELVGMHMSDDQERHAILAIQTKKPVAVRDAFHDERFNREHLQKYNIYSVLVVPVIIRDEAIGVIYFNYQKSTFDFKDSHIDFAVKLAASLSLALENSQLVQSLKTEIEERKRAQKQAEWMALFPAENPNPVLRVSNAGEVLYQNQAAVGLSNDEIQVGGMLPQPFLGLLKQATAQGLEFVQDIMIGNQYYSFSVVPIQKSGYVNLYGTNITQRVKAEWGLHESEERFRHTLSTAPITVSTLDRELRFTWVYNSRVGRTTEMILGKPFEELIQAEKPEELRWMLQTVLDTGEIHRKIVTYSTDDKRIVMDLSVAPLLDQDSQIIGVMTAGLDITQVRAMEEERIQHQAQIHVQRRLIRQREMERLQITRNLHDGPFQTLNAANMGLMDTITQETHPAHLERLQWVQQVYQQQINEMREFIQELRPPALVSFGLDTTIRSHIARFQKHYPDIHVRLHLMRDGKALAEESRLSLYRIYQEIISNVGRHAHAQNLTVALIVNPEDMILEIEDDGEGFTVPEHWSDLALSDHLGLINLREYAEMIGAKLEIHSEPGNGTRVWVQVPIETNSPTPF